MLLEDILIVVIGGKSRDDSWNSILVHLVFLHVNAVDHFLLGRIDEDGWNFPCERVFVQLCEDDEDVGDFLRIKRRVR